MEYNGPSSYIVENYIRAFPSHPLLYNIVREESITISKLLTKSIIFFFSLTTILYNTVSPEPVGGEGEGEAVLLCVCAC